MHNGFAPSRAAGHMTVRGQPAWRSLPNEKVPVVSLDLGARLPADGLGPPGSCGLASRAVATPFALQRTDSAGTGQDGTDARPVNTVQATLWVRRCCVGGRGS